MSIAERLAVQTIDGSKESMLDNVGGVHDHLPFFLGLPASRSTRRNPTRQRGFFESPPLHAPNTRNGAGGKT
jgi:hypothetical protein